MIAYREIWFRQKSGTNSYFWLIIIGLCLGSSLFAGPRLAVVPNHERATLNVTELTEAAISRATGLELVTRRELATLLVELNLQQLSQDQVGRVGELLHAELFLFVESVPDQKPPLVRLHVVETQTGLILADTVKATADLLADQRSAVELMQRALATYRLPLDQRQVVGLLGFRNESLGPELDPIAEGLGLLLQVQLNQLPEVVVVDRSRIEQLLTEETLTGQALALRNAAILLEAGIKAVDEGYRLTIARRQPGSEPQTRTAVTPATADAARQELAGMVKDLLALDLPVIADPKAEAAYFLRRSQYPLLDREERRRAAAAAYALLPNQANLLNLANQANRRGGFHGACPGPEGRYAADQYYRYFRQELIKQLQAPALHGFLAVPPVEHPAYADYPFPVDDIVAERDYQRLRLALNMVSPEDRHVHWHDVLLDIGRRAQQWAWTPAELAHYYDEIFSLYEHPPGAATHHKQPSWWRLQSLVYLGPNRFRAHPERVAAAIDAEWTSPSLWRRMIRDMLIVSNERSSDRRRPAARRVVDLYLEGVDALHQQHAYEHPAMVEWTYQALQELAPEEGQKWGDVPRLVERCLTPWIKAQGPDGLAAWLRVGAGQLRGSKTVVFDAISQLPPAEAAAIFQQLLDLTDRYEAAKVDNSPFPASLRQARGILRDRLDLLRGITSMPPAWQAFRFQQLPLNRPEGDGWEIATVAQSPGTVAVLWYHHQSPQIYQPLLYQLADGQQRLLTPVESRYVSSGPSRVIATDGEHVYLGRHGQFVDFGPDGAHDLRGQDFPFDYVLSIATLGGKAYVWVSDGQRDALVRYDPGTQTVSELFTNAETAADHPLAGKNLRVRAMYGDDARGELWFGLDYQREFGGIWRYNPTTQAAHEILPSPHSATAFWQQGKIVLTTTDGSFSVQAIYQPSLRVVPLTHYRQALFGEPPSGCWPMAWMGAYAISFPFQNRSSTIIGPLGASRLSDSQDIHLHDATSGLQHSLLRFPDGQPAQCYWPQVTGKDEVLLFRRPGQLWKVTRREPVATPGVKLVYRKLDAPEWQEAMAKPALTVESVQASSTAPSVNRRRGTPLRFDAKQVLDGHLINVWGAATDDPAPNLTFYFARPVAVHTVALTNGGSRHYPHHPRPRTIRLTFDNGEPHEVVLQDFGGVCTQVIDLPQPRTTQQINLQILDTYPAIGNPSFSAGPQLAELRFYGPN